MLKAQLRAAEDDLVKAISVKTRKEAQKMVISDSISGAKARIEELKDIVDDKRTRKEDYAEIISRQSKVLDCHPHVTEVKKLIQELNITNGLYNFVRTMRTKFQEISAGGNLPEIASHPQETTFISMSAAISSVSTDSESGSPTEQNHFRQADRIRRKARHVQGVQSSIQSPGSASSLRRSPLLKVKK